MAAEERGSLQTGSSSDGVAVGRGGASSQRVARVKRSSVDTGTPREGPETPELRWEGMSPSWGTARDRSGANSHSRPVGSEESSHGCWSPLVCDHSGWQSSETLTPPSARSPCASVLSAPSLYAGQHFPHRPSAPTQGPHPAEHWRGFRAGGATLAQVRLESAALAGASSPPPAPCPSATLEPCRPSVPRAGDAAFRAGDWGASLAYLCSCQSLDGRCYSRGPWRGGAAAPEVTSGALSSAVSSVPTGTWRSTAGARRGPRWPCGVKGARRVHRGHIPDGPTPTGPLRPDARSLLVLAGPRPLASGCCLRLRGPQVPVWSPDPPDHT